MLIEQPPLILRMLYPRAFWRMDKHVKAVYLTFDDGPIPEITPWVLDLLDKYNIKATFFLVGDNVRKHPEEFKMIVDRGHRLGNHTFNHIRGFEYRSDNYLANTDKANELIPTATRTHALDAIYGAPPQIPDSNVGPRHPRLQQTTERAASATQGQALCAQRLHHHLPRLA